MENNPNGIFFDKLAQVIDSKELIKLIVSNQKNKSSGLLSIIVTIAQLKRGYRLNFVYRHTTKDITKNYEFTEGIELLKEALATDFNNADLFSNHENVTLVTTPAGKVKTSTHEPTLQPFTAFHHDRIKVRLINTIGNIYLRELGITNANWEVRREMSDKYKQINRYIELIEPELKEITLPSDYHVVDMGSGKGYLTFALYDYLANSLGKIPVMTGVEFREDLVQSCNLIAEKSKFDHLNFISGTIEKVELNKIDILIALHACDTATDDAIYRGITSNASLIVCAPCCHKQIRKELNVTNELNNIVKYGILKERQAEIITDTIRAMILEAFGYKTKVFEFISTEHTPKNVMIIGRKTAKENPDKQKIFNDIKAIREVFGIEKHYLEELMRRP
ncbi:MAG: SAM-dependent methyltransferase [Porphyromonadaceae bacterium]|nr:MAG: SAM-dependent methyltransferase [Porphyromonadaceae bacterium]